MSTDPGNNPNPTPADLLEAALNSWAKRSGQTRPETALCGAKHEFGRCGLPANGHNRHRARTVYGEVEWNEPEPTVPARYPAGTRILVEAEAGREQQIRLVAPDGKGFGHWAHSGEVIVHGTVDELNELLAAADELLAAAEEVEPAITALRAERDEARKVADFLVESQIERINALGDALGHKRDYDRPTIQVMTEQVAALRAERDNLAANAARLRQERGETRAEQAGRPDLDAIRERYRTAKLGLTSSRIKLVRDDLPLLLAELDQLATEVERLRQERDQARDGWRNETTLRETLGATLSDLRTEVERIADELDRGNSLTDLTPLPFRVQRAVDGLRAALATQQATQPPVAVVEPQTGAGVADGMHEPSGGSVDHDRAEVHHG